MKRAQALRQGLLLVMMSCVQAQMKEMFQTLDANGDLQLDRKELSAFSQAAIGPDGQPLTTAGQVAHFDGIDVDGSGYVSYEEFMTAASMTGGGGRGENSPMQDPDPAADAIIGHFDEDHDGKLNAEELAAFVSMSHGVTAEMIDRDGDGWVTKEELMLALASTHPP